MNIRKIIQRIFLIGLIGGIFSQKVGAEEQSQSQVGFSVGIVESNLQRVGGGTDFDLRVIPETKATVQLVIHNKSDEEGEFNVQLNRSKTNSNFLIVADKDTANREKAPADIEKLVRVDVSNIKIPARTSKFVTLSIDMQKQKFDGFLIGGITVTKALKEQNSGYNNVYSYLKMIVLSETDKIVRPELTFNDAQAISNFGRNNVAVNFSNTQAMAFEIDKVVGMIKNEKTGKVTKLDNVGGRIAPNSSFDVLFNCDEAKKISGLYHLDMWIYAKNGQKWHFSQNFQMKETTDQSNGMMLKGNERSMFYPLLIVVFVLVLLFIFYLWRKRKEALKK